MVSTKSESDSLNCTYFYYNYDSKVNRKKPVLMFLLFSFLFY